MSKSYLRLILSGFLFINFLFSLQASDVQPSSALEFQQTTDTRIEVEDNFLRFYTGASERMTIDGSGNVGIGTVTPSSRFHVEDNTGGNFGFVLKNIHDAGHGLLVQGGGTTGNRYIMQLKDALGTDRVTVKDTGQVGIGITNPASKLHIKSNGYLDFIIIDRTDRTEIDNVFYIAPSWSSSHSDQLRILSGNSVLATFEDTGNLGIGTTDPSHKLHVVGNIHGSTFTASNPPSWPDYVFEDNYELSKIEEVEKYIKKNHHLPEIPSAAEVKENGVDIVSMQAKLLQKIEELTLYVIEQNKKIESQQERIEQLEKIAN